MASTAAKTQPLTVREDQVSNGAKDAIETGMPYRLEVSIVGVANLMFHRYNDEEVAAKSAAAKGSKAKKTDNLESYVYRTPEGLLGIPGYVFTAAVREAGRFRQDPRSPRKSMVDLIKAGVLPLDDVAPLIPETTVWDFDDVRRVVVGRAAVSRHRPAMRTGWRCTFNVLIATPEYLQLDTMSELITQAGRLCGLCDFRPSHGRFSITAMAVHDA